MKQFMKQHFLIVFLLLISCQRSPFPLEYALQSAGSNRPELEKVLAHYSANEADSLKYKAAVFLIENMPWHYSYGGECVEEYRRQIDRLHPDLPLEIRLVLYSLPGNYIPFNCELEGIRDIEVITADFLIHTIEQSFAQWENRYWLRDLSFEDFCEYILPYRVENEPLMHWKDSLPERHKMELADVADHFANVQKDAYGIYKFLKDCLTEEMLETYIFRKFELPNGEEFEFDCMAAVLAETFFWRMCGIPAAKDVLPAYGHTHNGHSEISIIDPRSTHGSIPGEIHLYAPKVFRRTFAADRSKYSLPKNHPYIHHPLYKDVTSKHTRTADLSFSVNARKEKVKHLYLAVFDRGWKPVAVTEVKRGKAHFEDMGVGIVYIPFYYNDNQQVFISNPFYLRANGDCVYFDPDKENTQQVELTRKCKLDNYKIWWSKLFVNGRFEASGNRAFSDSVILHTVEKRTYCDKVTIETDPDRPFRYYRFINNGWPADLAEIHFYDADEKEIRGEVIGDTVTLSNENLSDINDNDMLSFAAVESWVGFDFGREVSVSRIDYLPRNDTNGIYPGMVYELLYFDQHDWSSLGRKTATDYSIRFDDVPKGALLWLRNLSEGKEERIFTYENGKQYWY
ncbi:hypothetical protein M2480_002542 [Parabacteroides sp. PFB2-12]|uniref:hypothetical protein n=1 Tax=unclassified Parabacteroides TaxID=2649774 RepID=UPI002475C52D|nr:MULTISPECIES: hypothetical protein [unclassified Parabacteroides]MDH6344100.1 hypothetical protein [Parabacteroides sp. PM6-13]MDH6391547.1 hypothetical protein [Parabacteroides sp. PFB2-12]